jgi:translation elongation factor EF-1alpha
MTEHQGAPEERPIGQVTDYFSKVGVAAIDLSDRLTVGQRVHIRGHTTDLTATVDSMQIEHEQVAEAGPGASIGIKVSDKVRPGDMVYLAR